MTSTNTSSVVHDSFTLERTYPVAPARVFAAWSSIGAKSQWFGDPDEFAAAGPHTLDFRVGGAEHLTASPPSGQVFTYSAVYQDIVPDERIIASYEMTMDGRRISVSIYTVQLIPVAGGTKLVLTEQGAFLDGLDTNAQREEGTAQVLDKLGEFLAA